MARVGEGIGKNRLFSRTLYLEYVDILRLFWYNVAGYFALCAHETKHTG